MRRSEGDKEKHRSRRFRSLSKRRMIFDDDNITRSYGGRLIEGGWFVVVENSVRNTWAYAGARCVMCYAAWRGDCVREDSGERGSSSGTQPWNLAIHSTERSSNASMNCSSRARALIPA